MRQLLNPKERPLRAAAALALLAATVTWALLPQARAAMLEAEQCTRLKAEEAELTKAGVRGHLSRGPDWARTNLNADGVERVRRLITVDEQIAFRCPRPPPPKPVVAEGEGAGIPAKKPKAKSAKADVQTDATQSEARPKPKPKPRPKTATADDGAASKPTPKPNSKPKPKTKPAVSADQAAAAKVTRPKADDAFSPTNPLPK